MKEEEEKKEISMKTMTVMTEKEKDRFSGTEYLSHTESLFS